LTICYLFHFDFSYRNGTIENQDKFQPETETLRFSWELLVDKFHDIT